MFHKFASFTVIEAYEPSKGLSEDAAAKPVSFCI